MRLNQLELLHPLMRERVGVLLDRLAAEGIPLKLYETVRSPWRQAQLYAQGRSVAGKTVTRAKAWQSFHQYGVAVDMVFLVNGKWDWTEPKAGMWKRYHELAQGVGLDPLSFEMPHVQLPLELGDLVRGVYPPIDDEDDPWFVWLQEQIEKWGSAYRTESGHTHPKAPPLHEVGDRPAMAVDDLADEHVQRLG